MPILSQLRKNENAALGVGGVTYYNTLDSLPITGLTSGDQAFVSATERYYVSDGNGWFNTTLINKNIRWDSGGEPSAEAEITDSATPLIIIARAADSDQSVFLNQSFASDSAQYMATVTNDSSVFTFTPKTAAQIGASVAAGELSDSNGDFIYTFKWSDGLSFVNKAVTITYNPAGGGGSGGLARSWGGPRGFISGGEVMPSYAYSNTIQYWDMSTPSNAQDFGDLTMARRQVACASNGTRSLTASGGISAGPTNRIDYITCATPGNAIDFGDVTFQAGGNSSDTAGYVGRTGLTGVSNGTYGIFMGGQGQSTYGTNVIDRVTIASTGNATDIGDLVTSVVRYSCSTNDETRGIDFGGFNQTSFMNRAEYITMANTGNATSFGSLVQNVAYGTRGVVSNNVIGVFGSGYKDTNWAKQDVIQQVTLQTTATSTTFGTLDYAKTHVACTTNGVTGFWTSFGNGIPDIQQIVLATGGNATDFGDLAVEHEGGPCGSSGNAA